MTKTEYEEQLKKLQEDFKKAKMNLAEEFVFSNLKYKEGDIITDNVSSIKVDTVKWGYGFVSGIPEAVYHGYELKKDLTPRKDKSRRAIWMKIDWDPIVDKIQEQIKHDEKLMNEYIKHLSNEKETITKQKEE